MSKEIEQLTEEVLGLEKQIGDNGRLSVPFVIECGQKLYEIRNRFRGAKGRWEEWCVLQANVMNERKIRRYKSVYIWSTNPENRSKFFSEEEKEGKRTLVSVLSVTDVYEKIEEENKRKKKPKVKTPSHPSSDDSGQDVKKPEGKPGPVAKPKSKYEYYYGLLVKVKDLDKESSNAFTKEEAKRLRDLFPMKWFKFNGVKPVVLPELDLTTFQEAV